MQLNSKIQNLTLFFCVSLHCLIPCSLYKHPSIHVEAMFHYLLKFFFIYFTLLQRKKEGEIVKKQVFSLILFVVYGGHPNTGGIQHLGVSNIGGIQHLGAVQTSWGIQRSVISSCITIHLILPIYVNYSIIKYIETLLI